VRRLAPDGLEAWKQVVERGYEGYVAKDERSMYEGGATKRWLKVHGWSRETGGKVGNPPGFYRGLEDEGPSENELRTPMRVFVWLCVLVSLLALAIAGLWWMSR
jgi:hypothetical protein